ncbi:MAG: TRAP transporter small permease [Peptostreptococcales bacterium]|jgi:TRAP-type C4-dicarboxylate transport system permease small subunit
MKYYNKICDFLNSIALNLASLLLFFSFSITVLQVFSRYIFKFSFPWIEELSRYLIVLFVFLVSGYLLRNNENPYVEFIVENVNKRTKFWIETFIYVLISIFLVFLLVNSAEAIIKAANKKTPSLRILWSYPYSSIPIGAFLMLIQMPYLFVKNFQENYKKLK